MKGTLTACLMLILWSNSSIAANPAQVADTSKQNVPLWWYTLPKAIYVDHTFFSGFKENYSNDKIKVTNDPLFEQSTRMMLTAPIFVKKKGFTLTTSLFYNIRYGQYNMDVNGVRVFHNKRQTAFTTIARINLIKVIKLKSLTIVLNGSAAYIARQIHEPQRVTGRLSGMVYLIANKKQSFAVGLVGIIDNRVLIPVLPLISYTRVMKNNWTTELLLPSFIRFRKIHNPGFFTTLGIKVDNFSSYYLGSWTSNGVVESRNTYVKAFVGLEKRLYKSVWFDMEAGYLNRFKGSFTKPEARNNETLVQGRFASNLYFNMGVFIKPSHKVRKK